MPSWLLLQIIRKRSKAVSLRRCRSARPVCAVYWASASTAWNRFTVGQAAQGLANLIVSNGQAAMDRGVAIAYDSRHFSAEFAKQSACIMAANGIQSLLFDELRPTPELSFAVRHYGCIAGINITASHNPKEYNGYKVYWEDGAQLPPAEADVVASEMAKTDIFTGVKTADYDESVKNGLIRILSKETDEALPRRSH